MTKESGNSTVNYYVYHITGPVFTGPITDSIVDASVSMLHQNGNAEIKEALNAINDAIKTSHELTQQQQTESLEQLNLLSREALLPQQQRNQGLIKPILTCLATTLSAGGGAAEIWSTWGSVIMRFFGLGG